MCFHAMLPVAFTIVVSSLGGRTTTLSEAGDSSERTCGAEAPELDDSGWETVRVPHDWAIAGPFDPRSTATREAALAGRRLVPHVLRPRCRRRGRQVYLDFDGVMAFPKVYLNGRLAGDGTMGTRPSGWTRRPS